MRELRPHLPGGTRVPSLRLTIRTGIASLVTVAGAVAVSCQGGSSSNCSTAPSEPVKLSADLASTYFISSVDSHYLPAKYADSAQYQLRVWSDTLRLTLTDSSYGEAGRVGVLDTTSGTEVIHDYVLAGKNHFTKAATNTYAFPAFLGGSATATATPSYGHATLTLKTPAGQTWYFFPGVQ